MKQIVFLLALLWGTIAPAYAGSPLLLGTGNAGTVLAGTPIAMAVLSNGWQAQATFKGMTCAGVTSAYALTPDATPKVTLAVTSPGFDTSGAATTVARTVQATMWLRQPYSSNTSPTETQSGADCITTLALSDFVNSNDTATASFLSGVYTSGIASGAKSGLAVTNSAALAHPIPVCQWITPAHLVIAPASTFTLEIACFHARPRNGKQVQAIKFDASDGTNHAYCTTSAMSNSALITTGNIPAIYSCTYSVGAFAGLTAGSCAAGASCEITIDFTAYPIIGDQSLTASNGQDGTPIAASVRTPNLHAQNFIWDQNSKYSPIYGWICPAGNDATNGCTAGGTGTCATNACISTSSSDPGKGVSLNYATLYTFANNCRSYNNANRGHNDTSGCVGFIRKTAAINGTDPATELTTLSAGLGWLTFKAAPGETAATVVMKRASSSTGNGTYQDRTWFEGIGFTQVDTAFAGYNSEVLGQDSNNSNPVTTEFVCNLCSWTTTAAGFPIIWKVGLFKFYNSTIDETASDGSITFPFSVYRYAPMFYGGTITVTPSSNIQLWLGTAIGVQMSGLRITVQSSNSANFIVPTGPILFNNTVMKSTVPFDVNPGNTIPFPAAHFADVQNIYEKTTVDAGLAHRFLADANETAFANYIEQYDTIVGGRENLLYNDGTGTNGAAQSTSKQGVRLFTVLGPMANQGWNIKSDTFDGSNHQNAARIGNWAVMYGVGNMGDVVWQSADANSGGNQSRCNNGQGLDWLGDYCGLTGSGTSNNEGWNQQVAFTNDKSAGGSNAGNGSYTITGSTGSPAYGRVPAGYSGLPFDIAGTARPNDGTGCSGAYEGC